MVTKRKEDWFARFEQMGEDHVRLWLQQDHDYAQFTDLKVMRGYALEWLAPLDEQSRRRSEASQAESLETAKSAKDAAWEAANAARDAAREAKTANIIATLALIAAAIAIAVSAIGLFLR